MRKQKVAGFLAPWVLQPYQLPPWAVRVQAECLEKVFGVFKMHPLGCSTQPCCVLGMWALLTCLSLRS